MVQVRLPFNQAKATEAAARLLLLSGSAMGYVKLIKLLYLADRRALLQFGRPITTDCYLIGDQGPSLSQVGDLITTEPVIQDTWQKYISELQGHYEVELRREDVESLGELSEAEIEVIKSVFSEFGNLDQQQLIDLSRKLPEWHDPQGTKIPLGYVDILKAGGKTASETDEIVSELGSLAAVIGWTEPYHVGASLE